MDKRKKTGTSGEEAARRFLKNKGYRILGTNVELFCGEIDILAKDKKSIVIVEVKTTKGLGWGSPQELVRRKKQQKLKQLAKALEQEHPKSTIRIDVVGVYDNYGKYEIEHLVNAVN